MLAAGFAVVAVLVAEPAAARSLADAVTQLAARGDGSRERDQADPHQAGFTSLFGSRQSTPGPLTDLPQWQRVVADHAKARPGLRACLKDARSCRTPFQQSWRQVIESAREKDTFEKLVIVNRFFNQWSYSLDEDLYAASEYWATPHEFLTRSGDCEDYAIAKYFALRDLGFTEEDLRIVILYDRSRGIGHAVLTARYGQDQLVLDSLSDALFSHRRYAQYRPQYSMNESRRWRHRMPEESRPKVFYEGLLALRPD